MTRTYIKLMILSMILALAQACAPVSLPALCTASESPMSDHAAALIEDGGDRSVVTGDYLMRVIDAGCGR